MQERPSFHMRCCKIPVYRFYSKYAQIFVTDLIGYQINSAVLFQSTFYMHFKTFLLLKFSCFPPFSPKIMLVLPLYASLLRLMILIITWEFVITCSVDKCCWEWWTLMVYSNIFVIFPHFPLAEWDQAKSADEGKGTGNQVWYQPNVATENEVCGNCKKLLWCALC